jgi:DNA-binding PadR family transcriptional regulator
MSRPELTPFSYVVLALIGEGGAGAHDLVRMARQGAIFWAAADSQYYAEPKRLRRLGYLTARREPGKTRERTHYELTERGREALRGWLAEPVRFPRIQHEAVVKVLASDLGDRRAVARAVAALREDLADLSARLDVGEAMAATLPHRERQLRLNHRLARRLVEAHREWVDEVERELGS